MEFWPGAFPIWFRRRIPGTFGSQPSSAYSPLQESGMMFWYDFSSLALSNNDPITALADKSGNGRTLTFDATKQPTYKTGVLNGLGAALFDASNDGGYTGNFSWGSYEASWYALFTSATTTDNYIAHFGPAAGAGRIVLYRQNASDYGVCTTTDVGFSFCVSTIAINTSPTVLSSLINLGAASRVQTYINGTASGTPSDGAVTPANFASNQPLVVGNILAYNSGLNGYLFELIGYNVKHDTAAHARIISYLQAKYFPAGFNFGVGDFADNAYTVSASQTSPAARVVVNTDADYAMIETYNDLGALAGYGDCGVKAAGSDIKSLENIATGTLKHSVYLGTKGTTRKVELINGIQSMQSGVRKGGWITGAFFNGSASVVSSSEPTTPRIMVYGDSISGGQAATNPSLSGWVQLLRNTYSGTGSVVLEGWGNRKLKDDCPDTGSAQTFAEHIADNIAPTIIWLAIGHNDLGAWTAAEFETAYGDFLDRLHTELPSAAIYAQTPIISNPDGVQGTFRTAIGNAQSTRAAFVTLVDGTDAAFPQVGDLSVDGVHPTTAGQAKHHAAAVAILGI